MKKYTVHQVSKVLKFVKCVLALGTFYFMNFSLCSAQTTISILSRNNAFTFKSSVGDFESITLSGPLVFKILNAETTIKQLFIVNGENDTVVSYNNLMVSGYFQAHTDKKITISKEGKVTGMTMTGTKHVTIPFTIVVGIAGGKQFSQQVGVSISNHDEKDTAIGIAYYDALMMSTLLQKGDNGGFDDMWLHYGKLSDMESNPFMKDYYDKVKDAKTRATPSGVSILQSAVASVNGFGVTNIADGLAQFLIARGKQEVDIAFFGRMKKFLAKHEECQALFPATTAYLNNIEAYQYSELLQGLRNALNQDLDNMIVGMNQLIDLPKYQDMLKALPEVRIALRAAEVVSELSQTKEPRHPDEIIHLLAGIQEWGALDSNLLNSWQLLDVISQSVHSSNSTKATWITFNDFSKLFADKDAMNIYVALVYQKVKGIAFTSKGGRITVQQFLASRANDIYSITDLVQNFILLANRVDKTIDDASQKEDNKTITNSDVTVYLNQAIEVIQYGFKLANTIKPGSANDGCIVIAQNAEGLYVDIASKNYNAAIKDAYNILKEIDTLGTSRIDTYNKMGKRLEFLKSKKTLTADEDMEKDITAEKMSRLTLPATLKKEMQWLMDVAGPILKYGNMMAGIVNAKSAQEAENAIQAAVLPAGSYSLKQNANWNISLNAYVGYGWDYSDNALANGVTDIGSHLQASGAYAPVGISISKSFSHKGIGAATLFFSFIDVGSLVSYRLANGASDTLKQQITLGSIISPSAQIMIDIPRTPLVFCFGWRYAPKLVYSGNNGLLVINSRNVVNASILIDIPFFTIHNWSYNK